ncbi:hypothetical protein [Ureaplasma ceti]|uniref:Uncharacterized protein n=1 Tax=Ureaplasma ceti TaxID=3119530 RepID=A0ABP9U5P3_9BACT
MQKKRKIALYTAVGALIGTAVVVPTALTTSNLVKATKASSSLGLQLYASPIPKDNTGMDRNIEVDHKLMGMLKEWANTNKVRINQRTNSLELTILPGSPLSHMTAKQLDNSVLANVVKVVQTALVQMNTLPNQSAPLASMTNFKTEKDGTVAHFDMNFTWSNQLPQKVYTYHITINNLYPELKENANELAESNSVSDSDIAWIVFGVILGFGLVALVVTAIYVKVRKTRMTENGKNNNEV